LIAIMHLHRPIKSINDGEAKFSQLGSIFAKLEVFSSTPLSGLTTTETGSGSFEQKLPDSLPTLQRMELECSKIMEVSMKANVSKTKNMDLERRSLPIRAYTLGNGKRIRSTARESVLGKTEPDMKDSGRKICTTATDVRSGRTETNMKDSGSTTRSTDKVATLGTLETSILELGPMESNTALGNSSGLLEPNILETSKTICATTPMECLNGQTETNIPDASRRT